MKGGEGRGGEAKCGSFEIWQLRPQGRKGGGGPQRTAHLKRVRRALGTFATAVTVTTIAIATAGDCLCGALGCDSAWSLRLISCRSQDLERVEITLERHVRHTLTKFGGGREGREGGGGEESRRRKGSKRIASVSHQSMRLFPQPP